MIDILGDCLRVLDTIMVFKLGRCEFSWARQWPQQTAKLKQS